MKKIFTALVLLVLATGCASVYIPPVPEYNLPTGAKIGIIIKVSEFPKHTHFGTTIFNNFVKDYQYKWEMEKFVFSAFKSEINAGGRFELVNLGKYPVDKGENFYFVDIKEKNWSYIEKNERLRKKLLAEGFEAVITIYEVPTLAILNCSQYGCTEFVSQGYGLFTRSVFGMDSYFASASFNASIQLLSTPVALDRIEEFSSITHFQTKNKYLSDFEDPIDFEKITEQELQPIRNSVREYINSFAKLTAEYLSQSKKIKRPEPSANE